MKSPTMLAKINGNGWIVAIVVNTLAIAALYWGIKIDIAIQQQQYVALSAQSLSLSGRVNKLDDKVDNLTWAIATNRKPERPR